MKNYTEQKEDLTKKHVEKLEKLEREEKLYNSLNDDLKEKISYIHMKDGKSGFCDSIEFNKSKHDNNKILDIKEIKEIINFFPKKENIFLYQDTFTGFRAWEELTEKERTEKVEDIGKIIIEFEQDYTTIIFYAKINDEVINIKIKVESHKLFDIGRLGADYKPYKGGYSYENTRLIKNIKGKTIKWGRGGSEYMNRITLYNIDEDEFFYKLEKINVKCFYENGDTITTEINGTFEDAKDYFLNNCFNIGSAEDNMQKCIKIELID